MKFMKSKLLFSIVFADLEQRVCGDCAGIEALWRLSPRGPWGPAWPVRASPAATRALAALTSGRSLPCAVSRSRAAASRMPSWCSGFRFSNKQTNIFSNFTDNFSNWGQNVTYSCSSWHLFWLTSFSSRSSFSCFLSCSMWDSSFSWMAFCTSSELLFRPASMAMLSIKI